MSETEDEAKYYEAVERRRAMPVSEVAINDIDFAMSQVSLCFSSGPATGDELRWVVWDRNLDGEHQVGIVWVGALADLENDNLGKPPGDAYWALRRAVAAAALRAVHELL